MFDPIKNAIVGFILEFQPFAYPAIVAAFVIAGIGMILGGQFRERATSSIPWIIVGSILVLGAIQWSDALYNSMQF